MNSLNLQSHRTQLVATGVAASLATVALFSAYTSYTRQTRRKDLNADVLRSIATNGSSRHLTASPSSVIQTELPRESSVKQGDDYDETLIKEQLARNYAFFGDEGMSKIRSGSVAIIGCGGVGSTAAVMLARSYVHSTNPIVRRLTIFDPSGISKIRLVDFDYVTLSSLNRHATAGLNDVGTPKVKCIERFIKQVSRWVEVDCRVDIWRKDNGGAFLEGVDWVVGEIPISI